MAQEERRKSDTHEKEIHIDQDWKLEYWIEKFETTEDGLMNAIKTVGKTLTALEKHFNKKIMP